MMLDKLITVVEAPAFSRRAEKLLSTNEHKEVIDHLAANPDEGDEIPGTGGIRPLSSPWIRCTRCASQPEKCIHREMYIYMNIYEYVCIYE